LDSENTLLPENWKSKKASKTDGEAKAKKGDLTKGSLAPRSFSRAGASEARISPGISEMRNEESNAMLPAEVVEDGDGVFESDTMVSSFSDSELKPSADKNVRDKITRLPAALSFCNVVCPDRETFCKLTEKTLMSLQVVD
jgi:hypothetical protein